MEGVVRMDNLIVIIVIVAIVGGALWYIRREKRRGAKCIGCPDSGTCSGQCSGCGCSCPYNK